MVSLIGAVVSGAIAAKSASKGRKAAGAAAGAANTAINRGISEIRNQFSNTSESFQPFLDAGLGGLQQQQQASTLGGLGDRLADIFGSGALDPLIAERTRAAQGQLAAGGLTRSGTAVQEIAGIPQELGFAIEQLLAGRQGDLANTGFTATQNLAQIGSANAANIGNLEANKGANTSSGILAGAQASASGLGQLGNIFSSLLTSGRGGASSFAFSDPRLKTNVVRVASLGELGVYQWDWIPEAKGTSIANQPTLGFMADEVEEKYPEYLGEFMTWKGIHYGPLLDHIEDELLIIPYNSCDRIGESHANTTKH